MLGQTPVKHLAVSSAQQDVASASPQASGHLPILEILEVAACSLPGCFRVSGFVA